MKKEKINKIGRMMLIVGVLALAIAGISFVKAIDWSNPDFSSVRTGFNGNVCKNDPDSGKKIWEWLDSSTNSINHIFTENDCHKENAYDEYLIPLPNGNCCPKEKPICKQNSSGNNCVQDIDNPVFICEDYDPGNCSDANDLAVNELTNSNVYCGNPEAVGEKCIKFVDCVCELSGGSCKPVAKLAIWNGSKTIYRDMQDPPDYSNISCGIFSVGDCSFDITRIDECNTTNTILLNWTASWDGSWGEKPDYCATNTKRVQCPAQLSFISIASVIIAIVLIVVLYIVLSKKKKKFREQGSRKRVRERKK